MQQVETTSDVYGADLVQSLGGIDKFITVIYICLGVAVLSYNHASKVNEISIIFVINKFLFFCQIQKAAMERMNNYAIGISQSTAYLYVCLLIIVDDILAYSRDIGTRNTLKELIQYLQNECINDPKLYNEFESNKSTVYEINRHQNDIGKPKNHHGQKGVKNIALPPNINDIIVDNNDNKIQHNTSNNSSNNNNLNINKFEQFNHNMLCDLFVFFVN